MRGRVPVIGTRVQRGGVRRCDVVCDRDHAEWYLAAINGDVAATVWRRGPRMLLPRSRIVDARRRTSRLHRALSREREVARKAVTERVQMALSV